MKKSQGEIFGIALMFVVIIIGIILYSKFQALDPKEDELKKGKYEILAESTLNTLSKMSTGCYSSSSSDSLADLIIYCQENFNSFSTTGTDPLIKCGNEDKHSCSYVKEILNNTLYDLFNNSFIGKSSIIFELTIEVPALQNTPISNVSLNNFNQVKFRNTPINKSNYRKFKFSKSVSTTRSIPTANREVNLDLNLYHR